MCSEREAVDVSMGKRERRRMSMLEKRKGVCTRNNKMERERERERPGEIAEEVYRATRHHEHIANANDRRTADQG